MKKLFKFFLLILSLNIIFSCDEQQSSDIELNISEHPRILLLEGEEQQITNLIESDQTWETMHQAIIEESEKILSTPTRKREMVGRRLLGTSREVLRRVFYLSYAYRMTGDKRFMVKAREDMVAAAQFSSWNLRPVEDDPGFLVSFLSVP